MESYQWYTTTHTSNRAGYRGEHYSPVFIKDEGSDFRGLNVLKEGEKDDGEE